MQKASLLTVTVLAGLLAWNASASVTIYAEYHLGEAGSLGTNKRPLDSSGNGKNFASDISGVNATIGVPGPGGAPGSTACLDTSATGNQGWYSSSLYANAPALPDDNFACGIYASAATNTTATQGDVFCLGGGTGAFKIGLYTNGWGATALNVGWIGPDNGVSGSFNANTWVHLALIRSAGVTTLYINGVAQSGTIIDTPVNDTAHLSVNPGGGAFFDGRLDEARVVTFTDGETVANILGYLQAGSPVVSVVTPPSNGTNDAGTTATFSVTAIGPAPLSYQWYFNTNTALAAATNSILTLPNVQPANEGAYQVVVSSPSASSVTSSVATLTVLTNPPVFTAQPVGGTNYVASERTFFVTATGPIPMTYQWYFNTNTPLAGATNSTLRLTNLQLASAGAYSVVVGNAYASATSSAAPLVMVANPGGYQGVVIADHPLVYYPLDDLSGSTNASEVMNFGANDGAYNGGTLQQPGATTNTGNSVSFNGAGDRVVMGNPGFLNFTNTITLEAWVNQAALPSNWGYIVAHGYTTTPNGEVVLRTTSAGTYEIASWNGLAMTCAYPIPQGDLGTWVHLVGTYDGTTWRLYRNGILAASAAGTPGSVQVNSAWSIGARNTGIRAFIGQIDEVAIYNYALSPAQVASHYVYAMTGMASSPPALALDLPPAVSNYVGTVRTLAVQATGLPLPTYQWQHAGTNLPGATLASLTLSNIQPSDAGTYQVFLTNPAGSTNSVLCSLTVVPSPAGYAGVIVADRPLAYYPLDDLTGSSTAAEVLSFGVYDGTYNGGTLEQAGASTNTGASVFFNGAGDYIDLGNPDGLNFAGAMTLEAWVNPQTDYAATTGLIVTHGRGGPNAGECSLRLSNGRYQVLSHEGSAGDNGVAAGAVAINVWTHLVATYDGSSYKLYVNGVLIAATNQTYRIPSVDYNWAIGAQAGTGANGFAGDIDAVAIYDYALTPDRVLAHYVAAAVPPSIVQQPASVTAYQGLAVTLNVVAAGSPPLSYQWMRAGTNLPAATNASLLLSNVQASDAGDYQVVVNSAVGPAVNSAVATVTVVPVPAFALGTAPGGVVLNVTGGIPNDTYSIVGSTNVAAPLAAWTVLATGNFDVSGSTSYTNEIAPAKAAEFFRLIVP